MCETTGTHMHSEQVRMNRVCYSERRADRSEIYSSLKIIVIVMSVFGRTLGLMLNLLAPQQKT
jgi:hypothetical protein